ncbi:MAG: cellulose biosynthesis protein BcsS [Nitrospirae bacterium]|nr:cellulose biosynthesis protein BcsS [Nitrospirota bacterium]
MQRQLLRLIGLIVPIFFILFSASTSMAASYSVLAGGEADTESQEYLYTGIIVEEPLRQNLSIMGKLWVDYLTYKFERDSEIIRARAPAFQPAIGVKFSGQDWSTTFWAGWEHRNTKIKPFREDVEVRGTTDSLVLQAELDRWIKAMTNLNFIISYSTENSYIWSRGRLKQELSSYPLGRDLPLRVGLEVIGQGNKDYSAFQVGPLVEIYSPSKKVSFLIHGGYKNSSSIPSSAYGGIELYFGF